ncbi:spore coat protein GerQ [Oikeobacillus pervagus]|nr:spore coat protein GerQ [Oikeobacillus pervagus]
MNPYTYGYNPQTYYPSSSQPYYTNPQTNPMATQGLQVPVPPSAAPQPSIAQFVPGMLPLEESYIENILRLNKGKVATVYATFENNREWNAKVFKGIIEAAGRDHVILSDPQTGKRYLIPMIYVDYITFDEEIEYEYPFGSAPSTGFPQR